jgi:hypothetical protein
MTTVDVPAKTLTADDVAALRLADTVSFHYWQGRGYIRATLDGGYSEMPRIYSTREQRMFTLSGAGKASDRSREMDTETAITAYSRDENIEWTHAGSEPLAAAFAMIHSASVSDRWKTIVRLLRAGDRVTLSWVANNNNGYVKEAGLYRDELRMRIDRDKSEPLVFLVEVSVCPDNSARMVRRHG